MDHDAKTFFQLFFAELERRAVPYVVLHSYQNLPEHTDSDVDYAVRDADIPLAHAILGEIAARAGWLLAQTLQYDIGSHYSVVVNPAQPGMSLKLDRCSHYTRNGCLFIRDEALLADRKKFNNFYIPCASSEFIYTLAKVFAKRKDIADYLPRLRELWSAEPKRSEELFNQVFGTDAGKLADWFNRPSTDWERLSVPMHARNRYRAPQRLLEWRRRLRRFLNPTGLRVAVLGEHRETVEHLVARLEKLEEPCFRRQVKSRFSSKSVWRRWLDYWMIELPACRRSTLILSGGQFEDLRQPRADLVFLLGERAGHSGPRFVCVDARDGDKAAATGWREIAMFLSRRDARRWKSLKPSS